tara:strand:- start:1378 stop:1881 length:504 start_codon:yes stop_codon:yes gene_type:complete
MKIPWYIHGNWKLDSSQLTDLENNLYKIGLVSWEDKMITTYGQDCKELSFLKNFYKERVDEIAKDQTFYNNSLIAFEFWAQMYDKKAIHGTHTHFTNNNVISFVHFLQTNNSKCFVFTNGSEVEIPQQQEGDFIVFPSYVSHKVVTHNSDYNRIVIAGNIKILEHEN